MVLPIVEDLREHGDLKERIWWCPTGPLAFLPIHSAGPYEKDEPGLPELVASSYTPTLHSLIRAAKAAPESFRLLAIGQPNTPDHPPLPGAKREMAAIRERFKAKEDQVTVLMGEEVTSHKFTKAIPDKTWLHFACHADQDEEYPFHSAFFIHDGPLKLSKLMRLDLTRVQFAMLSACLTSAGDATLPDECIHLAAGMQFTGVRSVIATMWSVADKAGLMATKGVYRHLLPDGGGDPDPANAAKALQLALLDMQKAKVPLAFRVPFIHTGL
ncbi:CHAT domain-containing protein [Panaeolus papilionaceus]|nr:CHAT domain-containing protein [Panaeolus papilionaceus]